MSVPHTNADVISHEARDILIELSRDGEPRAAKLAGIANRLSRFLDDPGVPDQLRNEISDICREIRDLGLGRFERAAGAEDMIVGQVISLLLEASQSQADTHGLGGF